MITYRPDISFAEDYYPLYAPGSGKAHVATWLEPIHDPFAPWNGPPPPSGNSVVMVQFREFNLNPTEATATDLFLGTFAFEVTGVGRFDLNWGFDVPTDAHIFNVEGVDVSDQVSTPIVWVPEPSTALLVGSGLAVLAGLSAARRRR